MADDAEWQNVLLGDIAAPTRNALVGGPFGSDLVSSDYTPTGVPVIRGENVSVGRWVGGDFVFVSPEKAKRLIANTAAPLDVVFTQRGANHFRQVAVVPTDGFQRLVISQSQMKLSVDARKADPIFIYYAFRAPAQQEYLQRNAIHTGVPHTNLSILRKTPLFVPPLRIQRAIARILGAMDDKIELNRRLNETLEAMARALFKSWFVDFDPVRAKAEGRDPGLPKLMADLFPASLGDSELGGIPHGWSAVPLYEIATYINGAAYGAFQPNDKRRGLPIIKIAELKAGVTAETKFSDVQMPEKYRITKGDILFSWSGNPDTSIDTFVWSYGPGWLNQHIFRVLPHHEHERPFVLSTLKTLRPVFAEIARNKQTTGLGHVTAEDMRRLLVARPDDRVMRAWDAIATPLDERTFQNDLEIHSLTALRDTLLPRLISGELRSVMPRLSSPRQQHEPICTTMIDEIALHREELRGLCRRFHVRRLDLFGSAARGDFDPKHSDVDFIVEFDRSAPQHPFDAYFGLKEELEALLGRKVDLVELSAVRNPYLKASIEQSRENVYAA